MKLDQKLYDLLATGAQHVGIEILSIGLGYTAVATSDGGIGLAYTLYENKTSCMVLNQLINYEGRPAVELLDKITSANSIERSMALATVNALNYNFALTLPEDKDNRILMETFEIGEGAKVAMVGYFGPLVKIFKQRQARLEILDYSRGLGHKENFYAKLGRWADVLLLTSTSILNQTTEEILEHVHPDVQTVMLGPSTPMIAAAFDHLPVHMLAGTVPLDKEKIFGTIRHGMGTPMLQKFSRKSFLTLR